MANETADERPTCPASHSILYKVTDLARLYGRKRTSIFSVDSEGADGFGNVLYPLKSRILKL
jgi:hypothetical protein